MTNAAAHLSGTCETFGGHCHCSNTAAYPCIICTPKPVSLFDGIEPIPSRDPFARGAGLPMSVETKNSRYTFTEHALMVDSPATCTVTCERGTFAGQSWRVEVADVTLTRVHLHVAGEAGLLTTAPTMVNDQPVTLWS